jgi:hypothetical protein
VDDLAREHLDDHRESQLLSGIGRLGGGVTSTAALSKSHWTFVYAGGPDSAQTNDQWNKINHSKQRSF